MRVLGLDIGGANIKASTADGESVSISFAIWQNRDGLRGILKQLPFYRDAAPDIVALTMTAELADCFQTKAEGVQFIIEAVQGVFAGSLIRVWLTSGEFAEAADAIELPQLAGASNWHALATWAGRAAPSGPAVLIDIGSTTTDIIPLIDGLPVPEGRTDLERLAASELLYTGVGRTPVCAIVQTVPLVPDEESAGPVGVCRIPVAAELFATTLDVHLLNGDVMADAGNCETADGRPLTREAAMNRLAHMLCCDSTELSETQLVKIAEHIAEQQLQQITVAVKNRCQYVRKLVADSGVTKIHAVISGSGAWLAERVIQEVGESSFAAVHNLSEMFVRNVSRSAPAFAVARLAAERCQDDLLPIESLY